MPTRHFPVDTARAFSQPARSPMYSATATTPDRSSPLHRRVRLRAPHSRHGTEGQVIEAIQVGEHLRLRVQPDDPRIPCFYVCAADEWEFADELTILPARAEIAA